THQPPGGGFCLLQNPLVLYDIGHLEFRQSALLGAQKISRSAKLQIRFRNVKTIIGLSHLFESVPSLFAYLLSVYQNAITLALPAANTSPQLVQLGKPESFGMLYNHNIGIGYIHTHFN